MAKAIPIGASPNAVSRSRKIQASSAAETLVFLIRQFCTLDQAQRKLPVVAFVPFNEVMQALNSKGSAQE